MQPKERIVRLFLQLVATFKPLTQANVATLGGKGLEAEIWKDLGIPQKHGFLIERGTALGQDLIRKYKFRFCPDLAKFPAMLRRVRGSTAFLDSFHLDFCGPAEENMPEIKNTIDFIASPLGARCLAMTVYDARENQSLKKFDEVKALLGDLMGAAQAQSFFQKLLRQQHDLPKTEAKLPAFFPGADPAKGAKREFGLFAHLLKAMLQPNGAILFPDRIERYVYVSRFMSSRPSRMRTYFFHFAYGHREFNQATIRSLAEQWTNSNLWWVNNDEVIPVFTRPIPEVQRRPMIQYDRIEALAKAAQGEALEQFKALLTLAIGSEEQQSQREATLKEIAGVLAKAGIVAPAVSSTEPPTKRGRGRPKKQTWEDLAERDQLLWKLKALETKQANGGKFPKAVWDQMIKDDFGYYDTPLGSSLRAAIARTSGKRRPQFEARIKAVFGNEAKKQLDRLDKLATK